MSFLVVENNRKNLVFSANHPQIKKEGLNKTANENKVTEIIWLYFNVQIRPLENLISNLKECKGLLNSLPHIFWLS